MRKKLSVKRGFNSLLFEPEALFAFLFFAFCLSPFALRPGHAARQEIDPGTISFFEQYCFNEVNRRRKEQGLSELILSERLREVARAYSRRMAQEGFFSHTDPQGFTLRDRLNDAGLKWTVLAENLLNIKGYIDPVRPAVERWMESPDHRLNILEPDVELSAVGVWISSDDTYFFTQIFLGSKPQPKPK
jgi:uncharacterized protein YkwD